MELLSREAFYITLPSNASNDEFNNNTSSSFRVDMAKLTDVSYSHSWHYLPRDGAEFIWIDTWEHETCGGANEMDLSTFTQHRVKLKYGDYEDKDHLMKTLNEEFQQIGFM